MSEQKVYDVVLRFKIDDMTEKGADIPRRELYRELRAQYLELTGETSAHLATLLDISPQSCSTLASGSNYRLPAWYIILRLCKLLGYELVITSDTVEIVEDPNFVRSRDVITVDEESEEESG